MIRKPMRFNLQFYNGKERVPIRDLDDLAGNMNINDLVDSFLSGDLERWLRTLNETERADKVSALEHDDKEETLLKLFDALDLEFPKSEVRDIIGRYTHQKAMTQARRMISKSDEEDAEQKSPVSSDSSPLKVFNASRFEEYKHLKEQIKSLDDNRLFAYKPLIDVLISDYADYFEIDCVNFYYEMYEAGSPLAVFTLLMNPKWTALYKTLGFSDYYTYSDKKKGQTLPINRNGMISLWEVVCSRSFYYASYNRPDAYLCFWEKLDYSFLLDEANEFRSNPDKPVKWLNNNVNYVSGEWKRLVPKDRKVIILHYGSNLEIEHDVDASEEDPFVYGLKCRRSGWRNCYADNVLIFMPFD